MWQFERRKGEPARVCAVRFHDEAIQDRNLAYRESPERYAEIVNCGMKPAGFILVNDGKGGTRWAPVDSIASWSTSCAIVVRAMLKWCGRSTRAARNGVGIFSYVEMTDGHASFVRYKPGKSPKPGDIFYVANTGTDGHVGTLLREIGPGIWQTAEGGGGPDGTRWSYGRRVLGSDGEMFDTRGGKKWRQLQGWWDCDVVLGPAQEEPKPVPVEAVPQAPKTDPETPHAIDQAFVELTTASQSAPIRRDYKPIVVAVITTILTALSGWFSHRC